MADDLNFLHGVWCPPVVKVQREKPGHPPTPFFEWKDGKHWHSGDELPAHIAAALPGPEWSVCESHRYRRIAYRRAA